MERDRLLAALQPVIILEPGTVQNPLLAFSGLGTAPLFYTPAVIPGDRYAVARLAELSPHRPLGRTQSAPLPQSPRSVQQKLQTQQLDQLLLERLKQQTHLGKLMSKRRLSHGEEGESERKGPERGGPSDRPRLTEDSTEDGPNGLGSGNSSEAHRPQVSLPWDLPRVRQKPPTPEVLGVIDPGWAQHRPLSRARSSPASAGGPERSPRPPSLSTGLVYDSGMLKHQCTCGNSDHLEHPGRIQSIYSRLQETGLKSQCEMYVPGKLDDVQHVLVDVGTGYYVEKDVSEARDFFTRKVEFLTKQIEKVQPALQEKYTMKQAVTEMLNQRIQHMAAMNTSQSGVSKA
ncbi:prefoldin subunit 5 [Chiloscyllium punctatum]|uniref:prefoldin subunit 5 n=1 Tax=Chiloscyllium punctatum TaxID=137246 RepID=UPI003B634952